MSGATGGTSSTPHFNSVEMREAEHAFRQAYPAFESTSSLDELRAREYARLDDVGYIYKAMGTSCFQEERGLKTGRSTISICPRSK